MVQPIEIGILVGSLVIAAVPAAVVPVWAKRYRRRGASAETALFLGCLAIGGGCAAVFGLVTVVTDVVNARLIDSPGAYRALFVGEDFGDVLLWWIGLFLIMAIGGVATAVSVGRNGPESQPSKDL